MVEVVGSKFPPYIPIQERDGVCLGGEVCSTGKNHGLDSNCQSQPPFSNVLPARSLAQEHDHLSNTRDARPRENPTLNRSNSPPIPIPDPRGEAQNNPSSTGTKSPELHGPLAFSVIF